VRSLRNPYFQVLIWALGIGSALTAIVLTVPWLPQQSSTAAHPVDTLYEVLAVASCYIFALVVSILLVSVINFRRRHNDLSDGEPIHGNSTLEAVWTAIPALLMVGTAIYSGLVLADIEQTKANTQEVKITGQQFAWTFDYPAQKFKAGELHLVKGTPYHFKLQAKDVIHSFWVPQFRMKKDAVPGLTTDIRVTPTRFGKYTLICTELCGLGHATMRAPIVVEDQAAFDKWAAQAKKNQNLVGGIS
jgi:cytochrome c oxidase subunit II